VNGWFTCVAVAWDGCLAIMSLLGCYGTGQVGQSFGRKPAIPILEVPELGPVFGSILVAKIVLLALHQPRDPALAKFEGSTRRAECCVPVGLRCAGGLQPADPGRGSDS
jgi:hypothetical protein